MFKTREALIPYLLLVAAVAGGLLWHESEMVPGLGRTVVSGQIAVGGPYALTDQGRQTPRQHRLSRQISTGLFRLQFLPGRLPDHVSGDVGRLG